MISLPGAYIPTLETKQRECWKFLDWWLNSEFDSRVHGQPSHSLPIFALGVSLLLLCVPMIKEMPWGTMPWFLARPMDMSWMKVPKKPENKWSSIPKGKRERKVLRVLPSGRWLPRNQGWLNFWETRLVTVRKSLHLSCWTELTCQGILLP